MIKTILLVEKIEKTKEKEFRIPKNKTQIKLVVFDMDGLLIDTKKIEDIKRGKIKYSL
jgi:hypothetical protein